MSSPALVVTPLRLRPLSIGDLLDEGVRLYRHNWIQLVTIAAIVTVPMATLQFGSTFLSASAMWPTGTARYSGDALLLLGQLGQMIVGLIDGVLSGLMLGAMIYVAGQSYLGRRVLTGQAYRYSIRRYLVTLGASILTGLLLFVLLLGSIIPCVGWLGGPPVIAFVMVNLSVLIVPVVMLEGKGVGASMRRSWALAKSQFWRILLVVVVLYLFGLALVGGPTYAATLLVLLLTQNPALLAFVSVATGALVNLAATPIQGVCLTLLYYDARVRREAFDLAVLVGDESPPENERESLFTRSDWKTLGLLMLVAIPAAGLLLFLWPLFLLGAMGAMRGIP